MKTKLILHPEAFVYNGKDSETDVKNKLVALVKDISMIFGLGDGFTDKDSFVCPMDIVECSVYKDIKLRDFISTHLEGDQIGIFYSLIGNHSEMPDGKTFEELKQSCEYHKDEQEVTSLVILNHAVEQRPLIPYIQFDNYELVYSYGSWLTLRRQVLGNHPGTPQEFINECSRCFDSLIFSQNCVSTLIDGNHHYLESIPRKIVYYLSCLNDGYAGVLEVYKTQGYNVTLTVFSGKYNLDRQGSGERNPDHKDALTFQFELDGKTIKYYCEPHLKISTADDNYPNRANLKHFNPRIYFNHNDCLETGKIYVGSIGKHQ
jgi:hypothetical protein